MTDLTPDERAPADPVRETAEECVEILNSLALGCPAIAASWLRTARFAICKRFGVDPAPASGVP